MASTVVPASAVSSVNLQGAPVYQIHQKTKWLNLIITAFLYLTVVRCICRSPTDVSFLQFDFWFITTVTQNAQFQKIQTENCINQLCRLVMWATLPLQDGLQVQDDLSIMAVATGLPLLCPPCHQIPRRHDDLSTRHRPSAQTCMHRGWSRMHVSHPDHTHMQPYHLMRTHNTHVDGNLPQLTPCMQLSHKWICAAFKMSPMKGRELTYKKREQTSAL